MSAPWIKVEHSLPTKPEVVAIASRLNLDEDTIVGKLIRLWVWADVHTFDGRPTSGRAPVHLSFVDRLTGVPGFAESLREVGWLEIDAAGGISFPNFDRHNSETAKSRADSNRRVAKHRAKKQLKQPPADDDSTQAVVGGSTVASDKKRECNRNTVTEPLPDKIRVDEIREERGNTPGEIIPEHVDYPGDVPGGWDRAEQEFVDLIKGSAWVIHPPKNGLDYLYRSRFRQRWEDEVWREMLPRALRHLDLYPPWHGRKLKIDELLKPETVPDILQGGLDPKPATNFRNGRNKSHLYEGAHPPHIDTRLG